MTPPGQSDREHPDWGTPNDWEPRVARRAAPPDESSFDREIDRLLLIVRVLTVLAGCVLVQAVIVLLRELV